MCDPQECNGGISASDHCIGGIPASDVEWADIVELVERRRDSFGTFGGWKHAVTLTGRMRVRVHGAEREQGSEYSRVYVTGSRAMAARQCCIFHFVLWRRQDASVTLCCMVIVPFSIFLCRLPRPFVKRQMCFLVRQEVFVVESMLQTILSISTESPEIYTHGSLVSPPQHPSEHEGTQKYFSVFYSFIYVVFLVSSIIFNIV